MAIFQYRFLVHAPVRLVSAFHFQPGILKQLTPPLMIMRVHKFEPLAEGSVAEFTMWMGPVPVRWKAVHSDVTPNGFTDTQVAGPMKSWRHTHSFHERGDAVTEVHEHIEYEHFGGLRGIWSRLLFPKIGLRMLFGMRRTITRRAVARLMLAEQSSDEVTRPCSSESTRRS